MTEHASRTGVPSGPLLGEPKKNSKRRSLLIQPGTIVAATRKASGDPLSPTPARQRPVTMFNPSISSLAELAARFGDDAESGAETNGDHDLGKQRKVARESTLSKLTGETGDGSRSRQNDGTMGPPPRPTGRNASARTQALRKSQADATKASNTRSQPRDASTPSRISRPLSTLQESTAASKTSRPESSASTASADSHAASNRAKLPSIPHASSTAPSNLALRRSATTSARHTRAQSAITASTATAPSSLPRLDLTSSTRRRTPTVSTEISPPSSTASSSGPNSASIPQLHRSAFTMHQQHYSPRKNLAPKPLTSSIMNASAPVESNTVSLETQLQQTQLLQLSLLHMQFGPAYRAYVQSARKRLGRKFEDTARRVVHVQEEEKKALIRRNVNALKLWGASAEGRDGGFAELVQPLAGIVNEVWLLTEEGGRMERTVAEFERWVAWIEEIWAQRKGSDGMAGAEFVDGLGDAWKAEAGALIRRLDNMKRVIGFLPPAMKGSNLERVVRKFGELIDGLVGELGLLVRTETLIVEQEKRWVDERMAALADEVGIPIAAGS